MHEVQQARDPHCALALLPLPLAALAALAALALVHTSISLERLAQQQGEAGVAGFVGPTRLAQMRLGVLKALPKPEASDAFHPLLSVVEQHGRHPFFSPTQLVRPFYVRTIFRCNQDHLDMVRKHTVVDTNHLKQLKTRRGQMPQIRKRTLSDPARKQWKLTIADCSNESLAFGFVIRSDLTQNHTQNQPALIYSYACTYTSTQPNWLPFSALGEIGLSKSATHCNLVMCPSRHPLFDTVHTHTHTYTCP